ncbi:MAG TPA: hypothetical protein VMK42_03475 [Anaeromyxobacteraceae bacterium]|nr:hypothetical protein [Anaeromyxobacteraceae bacterium]
MKTKNTLKKLSEKELNTASGGCGEYYDNDDYYYKRYEREDRCHKHREHKWRPLES